MAGVLVRRGVLEKQTYRKRPCDDGGRDWDDVAASQGLQHQGLGEAGRICPWSLQKLAAL